MILKNILMFVFMTIHKIIYCIYLLYIYINFGFYKDQTRLAVLSSGGPRTSGSNLIVYYLPGIASITPLVTLIRLLSIISHRISSTCPLIVGLRRGASQPSPVFWRSRSTSVELIWMWKVWREKCDELSPNTLPQGVQRYSHSRV